MNRNSFPRKAVSRLILILLVCLLTANFVWLSNAQCPAYQKTILGVPDYIDALWPPPNSQIKFSCYMKKELTVLMSIEGSISLSMIPKNSFKSQEIDFQANHPNEVFPPFESRVSLYVDNKKVKTHVQIAGSDSTPNGDRFPNELEYSYLFRSYPLLFPGSHTARVVIALRNGEITQYEWNFRIK